MNAQTIITIESLTIIDIPNRTGYQKRMARDIMITPKSNIMDIERK